MSSITILTTTTADAMMTKKLVKTPSGWEKVDYSRAYLYEAMTVPVNGLHELHDILMELEQHPRACVIRGKLIHGDSAQDVLRRKDAYDGEPAFFEENPKGVQWLMLDFDKVPAPPGLDEERQRLEYLVSMLPPAFHNASYHFQWSSSASLDGWATISAHLWFWLSEPVRDTLLTQRIEDEAWDVDESTIRTVQPNFTAAPIFDGCDDPLEGRRSGLITKTTDEVVLPAWTKPKPITAFKLGRRKPVIVGKSFQHRLDDIGPRYHMPIQRAIASFISIHGHAADLDLLKQEIAARIPSDRREYLRNGYIDASIRGALRKFAKPGW